MRRLRYEEDDDSGNDDGARDYLYIYITCKPCKAKILAEMKYIEKLQ